MDILHSEPCPCTGTCLMSSDDGSQVVGIKVVEVADLKLEEDPGPTTSPRIKTEPLNCMDILKSEPGSCIGTCQMSSDDGNQVVGIKVEGASDIKVEQDPGPAKSTGIKAEHGNWVDMQGSCTETCATLSGNGNQFLFVNIDEVTDIKAEEDPEPPTSPLIKTEPATAGNEQLCAHSVECAFPFSVCSNACRQDSSLNQHQQVNSGERPFCCDLCNKAFARGSSLTRHKRIHSGERPFCCDMCNKAFGLQDHLMRHKQIHSGERPFCCDVCNKAFARESSLMRHKQLHSGERPFSCDVCNKAFSRGSSLMRHKRIHSGERPFACDVCNKAFVEGCNLMRHQRVHSGERPFSCEVCNKSFSEKGHLRRHMYVHTYWEASTLL